MTIKEKLKLLEIDMEKDKKIVEDVKKALLDAGEEATRVSNKLTAEGLKIVDLVVGKSKANSIKKQVNRPKTIHADDKLKNENTNSDKLQKNVNSSANQNINELKDNKNNFNNESKPSVSWEKTLSGDNSKLKISIKGKNQKSENSSPNGNPLPQSTIEEVLRRKREAELQKKESETKSNSETNNKNDVSNVDVVEKKNFNDEKKNENVNNIESNNQSNNPKKNENKQNNNIQNNSQGKLNGFKQNNNKQGFNKQNNNNNNKQNNNNNKQNNNKQNNNKQNGNRPNDKFSNGLNKNTLKIKDNSKNFNTNGYNGNRPNNSNNKNKQNLKPSGFIGKNVKTTFNQENSNIAIGTNNHFEGRKKDKDKQKYNKDNIEQKRQNSKKVNNKQNKYKPDINDFDKDTTIKRRKIVGTTQPKVQEEEIKSIILPDVISINELAKKLKIQPGDIIKKLFIAGKMVTINSELTYEEAEEIAIEKNILCEKEEKIDVIAELLKEEDEDVEKLKDRPPVVCVMGHVDHGKTSILDAIRNTNVIAKEAGGITQHIGAYQVKSKDRLITFLDTPGHEAFTAMRLRGAKSTDIAILVVAADDGVKPQTIEAINHAKAANVEIIVAINKIDKTEANVERVKQQLSEYELVPADWGGQTTYCEVSAKQNIGIDNLLDMVLLTADVMELKANPDRKARGIVVESLLDKGKGSVARILVQKGTLHIGDYVAMGQSFGKIRAMSDCNGMSVKIATPSMPVEILGLNNVPQAGDTFICFDDEKSARNFAETFVSENKKKLVEESKQKVSLEGIFDKIKAGELKELNIVLKTDVVGSSEAVKDSLTKLSNDEVVVKVIHDGVGNISESDVTLASASNAIIIGFNVKPEPNAKSIIDKENVDLRLYSVIYKAIEDVENAIKGMLNPVFEEKIIGNVTVRQIFKASSIGNIAGVFVNDGEVRKNAKVRLKRNDKLLFEGDILSLKHLKDDVKEVKAGFEGGIVLDGFADFAVDDTMEVYIMEEKK